MRNFFSPCHHWLAAALVVGGLLGAVGEGSVNGEELRTVSAIRALPVEQLQQKISVRLDGVVTFFDEGLFSHFIQDDTAGIYLKFPVGVTLPLLSPGQAVEVTGTVNPGEYAPVVAVEQVQVTGAAGDLRTACERRGGQPVRGDRRRGARHPKIGRARIFCN